MKLALFKNKEDGSCVTVGREVTSLPTQEIRSLSPVFGTFILSGTSMASFSLIFSFLNKKYSFYNKLM